MDESLKAQFAALAEEADGLADDVEAAYDEHAALSFMRATRAKVDDLSRRFHDAMIHVSDAEKLVAERAYGRRIVDVQKMASRLPTAPQGKPVEKTQPTGFLETRAPKSSRPPFQPGVQPGERKRDPNKVTVTDEIDA